MLLAYSWKAVIYSQYSLSSPHTGRKEGGAAEEVEVFVDIIAIPSLPTTAQRLQVYRQGRPRLLNRERIIIARLLGLGKIPLKVH